MICCGKQGYSTRNAAVVAGKKSGFKGVRAYRCSENVWHITSHKETVTGQKKARFTLPTSAGPKPWVPSLAKLRRKLRAATELMASQTRKLEQIEQRRRAQQAERDRELAEVERAIAAMYERQHSPVAFTF